MSDQPSPQEIYRQRREIESGIRTCTITLERLKQDLRLLQVFCKHTRAVTTNDFRNGAGISCPDCGYHS